MRVAAQAPSKRRGNPPLLAVLLLGSLALALLLAACDEQSVSPPSDLLTPGVLTVGSDTTYPPQEYLDPTTQQPIGFDIDLISAIARRMGLKARIVSAPFGGLLDGLAARRYDVVISAVTITPARDRQVDFVPYLTAGQSLLVRAGNPHNITSTDDLCGLAIGVQADTIEQGVLQSSSDNCLEQDKPAITIVAMQDQNGVVQMLATNAVVATYQDSPVTDYYVKQQPDQYAVGGAVVFPAPEGIAVRKGDTAMAIAVEDAFDLLKGAGDYHKLIAKWGLASAELTADAPRPASRA
ncbi:MAG TPA: ABC transporter substrate-binding protein [Ktedonobacterales bacterium]|nr:ABC transporter substrate-binding protein [Ktedonobacterales bacterium]